MKHLLHIISSPKKGKSFSIKLGNAIIDKLLQGNPGSIIQTRDLTGSPFPHLEEAQIASFFTPREFWTDVNKEAVYHSDQAIAEVMAADVIVIGVPMYNFGVSSTLKAWIDHIARAGVTFRFREDGGVEGLVQGKKVYLAIATGGVYSEGPMKSYDFTESYLRSILGFIGITDITVFRVEGTAIPGNEETAVQKAMDSLEVLEEVAAVA